MMRKEQEMEHGHKYHHHDGAEICTCGHEHHLHENGEACCPYQLHGHIHEGAAVVSGRLMLPDSMNNCQKSIGRALEDLAARVNSSKGVIGHIKASATEKKSALFSVTKDLVQVMSCEGIQTELIVTVIVFSVELELLKDWLQDIFEELDEGGRI